MILPENRYPLFGIMRLRVTPCRYFTIPSPCLYTRLSAAWRQPIGGWERHFERARFGEWFSGPGAQRGFPSVELLPFVAVVLAGRHQGRVPSAREYRRQLRPRRAQPLL